MPPRSTVFELLALLLVWGLFLFFIPGCGQKPGMKAGAKAPSDSPRRDEKFIDANSRLAKSPATQPLPDTAALQRDEADSGQADSPREKKTAR